MASLSHSDRGASMSRRRTFLQRENPPELFDRAAAPKPVHFSVRRLHPLHLCALREICKSGMASIFRVRGTNCFFVPPEVSSE